MPVYSRKDIIIKKVVAYLEGHSFGTLQEVFRGIQCPEQPIVWQEFVCVLYCLSLANLLNVVPSVKVKDTDQAIIYLNMLNSEIDAVIDFAKSTSSMICPA